ncbi:DUF1850 domain-containing protein [Brevibacillus dissolubilis]|uniref:DUF1850 domain-containing protein n=1 Tax=Brevibacillus dissolubilis TaxID=1844116 RepID=UPI0011175950|nr:DUF1850 domain-containing protein [Brevibacillus dissolubilis]
MNHPNQMEQRGRNNFRLFSLLLISILMLAGILLLPLSQAITIRDERTDQLYGMLNMPRERQFQLQWTHSIHRTPVIEYYQIEDNDLLLTQMSFQDYGIGMESGLAPGEQLVMEDNQFVLKHMNRKFPALHLFIGQVRANHTLLLSGEKIPLSTLAPPGTAIQLQIERVSILEQIGG